GALVAVDDRGSCGVRVPAVADAYLTPGGGRAAGLVVLRTVGAGEMGPLAALGSAQSVQVRTVTVPVDAALAESIRPAGLVDLWVALPAGDGGAGATLAAPEPLVQSVQVAQVHEDTSIFAGADQMVAQVLVPVDDLADVLAAQTGDGTITTVPVPS